MVLLHFKKECYANIKTHAEQGLMRRLAAFAGRVYVAAFGCPLLLVCRMPWVANKLYAKQVSTHTRGCSFFQTGIVQKTRQAHLGCVF
jgi:hypothetical protein